jgi:hypothetical protein
MYRKKSWLVKKFLKIVTILILLLESKKVIFEISYKNLEPDTKFGVVALWSLSRTLISSVNPICMNAQ